MILAMFVAAETASGFPPVQTEATQQAARAEHKTGYLMTGGVQSIRIPLAPSVKAPTGVVLL